MPLENRSETLKTPVGPACASGFRLDSRWLAVPPANALAGRHGVDGRCHLNCPRSKRQRESGSVVHLRPEDRPAVSEGVADLEIACQGASA